MVFSFFISHPVAAGCIVLLAGYITSVALVVFQRGVRDIPGPFWAKFSRLWKVQDSVRGQAHVTGREIHEKYGDIVRVGPKHVSVADPNAVPIIYGMHSEFNKSMFYLPFNAIIDGKPDWNLFSTIYPAHHRHLRSGVAAKYSLSSLMQMEHLVDEVSAIFMKKIEKYAGQPFDLGEYLQWFAFDAIANISFKRTLGFIETESDPYDVISSIEKAQVYAGAVGSIPEVHYFVAGNPVFNWISSVLPESLKMKKDGFTVTREMAEEQIQEFDKVADSGRGDFIEYLRELQRKNPDKVSDHLVLQTIGGNLAAGSDTTAISMRAIFYYLIKNPRCYAKVQGEIDAAHEKGLLSEYITFTEAQTHLPYLQLVTKEAMRLHPSFGLAMQRTVPANAPLICGRKLPPGTEVGISAWVLQRNKSVFGEDADSFRPERWLESETDKDQLRQMETCFLAFGAGTRICIGRHISMMEMLKLVPLILRRWRIEWVGLNGSQEWKIDTQVFSRQTGIIVKFFERNATKNES